MRIYLLKVLSVLKILLRMVRRCLAAVQVVLRVLHENPIQKTLLENFRCGVGEE